MSNNICLIFARGGSKGLKNKNFRKFDNKPLIYYSIKFAQKYKFINEIYVSTDSKIIKTYCKKLGVKIIDRPIKLAQDHSPEILSWKHAIKYLIKKKIESNNIIILPVTSPLRNKKDLNQALKLVDHCDIVVSATQSQRSPYFNMLMKKGSYFNLVLNCKKVFRRQDTPTTYDITTNFYVTKSKYILKTDHLYKGKVKILEIPKERSIDIDDIYDFQLAEFLYKKNRKKYI